MERQKRIERELDLIELFWNILFEWRQIICFGVIFAVLLGGVKYVNDSRNYHIAQNKDMELEENALSDDEMQQVLNAKNLMARIMEYENYLETSALMQINLYEKPVVELQYYVDSDYTFNYTQENQSDYTSNLMTLYYNYIMSGEMSDKVIEVAELSLNQADISELWSVLQTGSTISIKFTCPEEKKMEVVAKVIKEQLSKKEIEYQEIGTHELKLLNESRNVVVDNALIDRRNIISTNIATLNTQLNTLKTGMTEQQMSLLNSLQADGEVMNTLKMTAKPRISIKYMILGAFLGIFLVCVWIFCRMLFNVKLQASEEICTLFNIRFLGEISVQTHKKHFLPSIDKWLLSVKNRSKKKLSLEQQIKIVSANVSLSCKQQGIDCIYMTGSEYENMDIDILNKLKRELSAQYVQVKEGGNIFYDAESLKQGTEIGNMLFVEQIGQSICDEVLNELNLAKDQKNNILGIIVFR